MSDRELGLEHIRREIERVRSSSNATVEAEHSHPSGTPDWYVWLDHGVGKRKVLEFERIEIDDCRDGVTITAKQRIAEAFRA